MGVTATAPGVVLMGRHALTDAAGRRLAAGTRVLTLTGRHGVGTTSVAVEVARQVPGPSTVVRVDDADDGAEYLARTLEALGLRETTERAVVSELDAQPRLLVLDGCRARDAARVFVERILEQVPDQIFLVTARTALGLDGEDVLPVPPLDLPDPDERDPVVLAAAPAVGLFLAAAERAAPTFTPSAQDLATVAEVCRRLDGLPQAIVLAAARLGLMRPAAMLTEMARLGAWELVGLSVADEVERSTALLDDTAFAVLVALSVMSGGTRVDAVAAVVGHIAERDVVESLLLLVGLHLVRADPERARYTLTASATQHVRDRLAGRDAYAGAVARHAQHYAAQAREFARRPHGSHLDRAWVLDHRNRLGALAALRASGDHEGALRLAVDSMTGFEHRGEPDAGRRVLVEVLGEVVESTSGACVQAHLWLGRLEAEHADGLRTASARAHFQTALRLARERGNLVIHLEVRNAICENQVVLEQGVRLCEEAVAEALDLTRAPELEFGRSIFLCWHAGNLHRRGRLDEAAETIAEAMGIARRYGDRRLIMSFGIIYWQLPAGHRRDGLGMPSLPELLEMVDEQGDVRTRGWIQIVLVNNSIDDGDDRAAVQQGLDMLRLARRTQQRPLARQAIVSTIRLLRRRPDARLGAVLAGALASHGEFIVTHLPPRWVVDLEQAVAASRVELGDEVFETDHATGSGLGLWSATGTAEQRLVELATDLMPRALGAVPPATPSAAPAVESFLTPREREVLIALAAGDSNKEVGRTLGMRPKTVAHHCASIYAKLGVRGRTEAVTEGLRLRLVEHAHQVR